MAQVGAILIDVIEMTFEAVLAEHVFRFVAADAFCAFAPVEDLAIRIDAVDAEGHLFKNFYEEFFVCHIHGLNLVLQRGKSDSQRESPADFFRLFCVLLL